MASRETGVVRQRLGGDTAAAQRLNGVARTQLGVLKELMAFGNLQQLSRTVRLGDGTEIFVQSVFGQDSVRITPPVGAVAAVGGEEEIVEAVNTVVDYVGVMMPNPVPYRGLSIGTVAPPTIVSNTEYSNGDSCPQTPFVGTPYTASCGGSGGTHTTVTVGGVTSNYEGATEFTQTSYYANPTTAYLIQSTHTYSNFTGSGGGLGYMGGDLTTGSVSNYYSGGSWSYSVVSLVGLKFPGTAASYRVVTSDGTTLVSEVQHTERIISSTSDNTVITNSIEHSGWSGGREVGVFTRATTSVSFSHWGAFDVPEDCVWPVPASDTPTYPGTDGLDAQWDAHWQAGVAAFKTRRTGWFKKNSDTTIASFATSPLPASWDYAIKYNIVHDYAGFTLSDGSLAGRHTRMPIIMSITSAADATVSDTSADLTQAGTKVTKRATTFRYVDAQGTSQAQVIDGLLTQVVMQHSVNGVPVDTTHVDTYHNWYVPTSAPANESLLMHQFLLDRSAYGLGLVWNGAIQQGYNATSAYAWPDDPLAYDSYVPPYPAYSNTLVGTAAPIYLQYHNTVLPQYVSDTAQSSTAMNNSAMYHVRNIELMPFGIVTDQALGAFSDPLVFELNAASGGRALTDHESFGSAFTIIGTLTGNANFTTPATMSPFTVNNTATLGGFTIAINGSVMPAGTSHAYVDKGVTRALSNTQTTQTFTGGDYLLTNIPPYMNVAGVLTSNLVFTVPDSMSPVRVRNSTTGAFTVTFKTANGSGVAIPRVSDGADPIQVILSDGTNCKLFGIPVTVEIYGKAIYSFDWETGAIEFKSWHTAASPIRVQLPRTTTPAYNCLIGYAWDTPDEMWPDVAEYLRKKIAALLSGGGDQTLYALIKQAIAL